MGDGVAGSSIEEMQIGGRNVQVRYRCQVFCETRS